MSGASGNGASAPPAAAPPVALTGLTDLQRLALRLAQFKGRLVTIYVAVSESGELEFWTVQDMGKVERLRATI